MDFEELLEKLSNPESDDDRATTFDELRAWHSQLITDHDAALGERDGTLAERDTELEGTRSMIGELETKLLEAKAFNYDAIMANGRETENVDPDIPDELDENEEDFLSFDDAFEAKEDN